MIVREPDGSATVYDENMDDDEIERRAGDGEESWVFDGSYAEARAWVFAQLGEIDDEEPESVKPVERVAQKKPCGECPFRRKAPAGWLGASDPEGFIGTMITGREDLPCHSTVNYERPDWHARWIAKTDPSAKLCAGALTLQANMLKRPRSGPVMEPDREHVFSTYAEFVNHHRGSKVQSWADPPEGSHDLDGLNATREMAGLTPLRTKKRR